MIRKPNMVKSITASGGGSLQADAGEAFRIKRISCVPSTNDTFLKVLIDNAAVGYWRVKGKSGNHISPLIGHYVHDNLWDHIVHSGYNLDLPIAEGQKLTVERYAEAGNVIIEYDIHDPADISREMPNGSDANERIYINYLNIGTALTASGDALCDESLNPSEFPAFPASALVPANHRIELLGLVGCPWCDGAAGPIYFVTDTVKLFKGLEILFDEDRNGIPFKGDVDPGTGDEYNAAYTLIGPATPALMDSATVGNGAPLMFRTPVLFDEGEELNVKIAFTKSGAHTWSDDLTDLACILRLIRK